MSSRHNHAAYPFRMPPNMRAILQRLADENDRSLNKQLIQVMKAGLEVLLQERTDEVKENAPTAATVEASKLETKLPIRNLS